MLYEDMHQEIIRGTARESLPRWASGVLDDITTGRRTVLAVRHPLGFLCLPLERRGDLGVCLHIWSALLWRAHTTTSEVHSHSWDLHSYVLYGRLRNVPAVITSGDTHRVFEVISHGDVDEIRATPRTVHYTAAPAGVHQAGDTYTLAAGAFHSTVIIGDDNAATIALGQMSADATDLSLGGLDTRTHRVHRQHCDGPETAHAARLAAQRLAATDAA